MHIIIIGCGKVGAMFAQVLSAEGHDVVIVDNDASSFKMLGTAFNGITVCGVPIDQEVLKHAGIETADALTAMTPDDNLNIMVCEVAKEIFKVPRVIARIYDPTREHVFQQFGLETVCPTNITVNTIKSIVLGEEDIVRSSIAGIEFAFRQEKVTKDHIDKAVGSIKVKDNLSIFGVVRAGKFSFASPNMKLSKDDILVIAEKAD